MFKDYTDGKIAEHKELLLHVDGGCEPKNPGGVATAGWVVYDPKEPKKPLMEEGRVARDGGELATNNYGEYASLCFALAHLAGLGWQGSLTILADSKLLVEQMNGRWKVKAEHLKEIRKNILRFMDLMGLHLCTEDDPLPPEGMYPCTITWVRRNLNGRANELCHIAYVEYTSKEAQ